MGLVSPVVLFNFRLVRYNRGKCYLQFGFGAYTVEIRQWPTPPPFLFEQQGGK